MYVSSLGEQGGLSKGSREDPDLRGRDPWGQISPPVESWLRPFTNLHSTSTYRRGKSHRDRQCDEDRGLDCLKIYVVEQTQNKSQGDEKVYN